MENIFSTPQQEVLYGSSDTAISKQLSRWERAGVIRKIAPRLYAANLEDLPEVNFEQPVP